MFGKKSSFSSSSGNAASSSSGSGQSPGGRMGGGGGGGSGSGSPHHLHQHPLSICGDCGASGPSWAVVNRGVLICSDCCCIHRSLGRHVSHVKCLRSGGWIPEQLTMVQSLYSCGANSIWEYSLLNPSSSKGGRTKKPQVCLITL